jgi:hypothetical protein
MVNQSTQKDPFHLLDVIRDLQVSIMQATPTTFEVTTPPILHTVSFIIRIQSFILSVFFMMCYN